MWREGEGGGEGWAGAEESEGERRVGYRHESGRMGGGCG